MTALEIQWGLLERAHKYEQLHGLACVGEAVGPDVLRRWEQVLTGLEHDPASVAHWVDWVAKQRLVDGYAERHGIEPGSAELKAIDLQYHDLRPDKCLAARAGLETIVDQADVDDGDHEAADDHPRLLPWPLPRQVPGRDRRGQLGLDRVRRRSGAAAAGPDDGATTRNRRPRG